MIILVNAHGALDECGALGKFRQRRHPRWIPLDHAPRTGSLPHKCGNAGGRGGRLPVSRRIRRPTRSRG